MADTQTYSHLAIQRYLQHKMSPQEMHEFEKALMNDPFLADALEGFSTSDATLAEEHLAAIERSLTHEKQEAKVVPLTIQKTSWWEVAAIMLVIISAAAITYSVVNNHYTDTANNKTATTTPQKVTIQKDSIRPTDKPLAQSEILPPDKLQQKNIPPINHTDANKKLAYSKQVPQAENEKFDSAEGAGLVASSIKALSGRKEEFTSAKRMMLTNAMPENEFKGKVTDKSGEPLPYAAIKTNTNLSAITDAQGSFTLKAVDTVLQVHVNSPGYVSSQAKIQSNKPDNKIALKEEELSLAEIVVTSLSKKKKISAATVKIDSTIAAEPIGGWRNFKQYLHQQLDSLKANDDNFDEDITLEFSIDKQGHPTDIKAAAEIDKMMADKAIKILANGPRWKNMKKDKKVKVIISF